MRAERHGPPCLVPLSLAEQHERSATIDLAFTLEQNVDPLDLTRSLSKAR